MKVIKFSVTVIRQFRDKSGIERINVNFVGEKANEVGQAGLLFTPAQFKMLLKNSNLGEEITQNILRSLNNGTLNIEAEYGLKGTRYLATESSTVVKNGIAKIGDEVERQNSGYFYGDLTKGSIERSTNNEMIFSTVEGIKDSFVKMFSNNFAKASVKEAEKIEETVVEFTV